MKPTQLELQNWAIEKIKTKFKDDVALLIKIPEHSLESDCHGECFDYFVPATENGYKLAQTFILDGVGHDLYPRSWERIANMAELKDEFTNGLMKAEIIYYRNDEDKNRFLDFQKKLNTNLNNKDFMYKKALEKLDTAMDIFRTMVFEDAFYKVKMGAGYIAQYLSLAIAYLNGTYIKSNFELETAELSQLKYVPVGFIDLYEELVKENSVEVLKKLSFQLIKTTRKFIESLKIQTETEPVQEQKSINYHYLASWYEELSLTFRRIYIFCDNNDYKNVYLDALNLQHELNIIAEEFNLIEIDLLGSFEYQNLKKIKIRTREIEDYIISTIQNNNIRINKYDTLEMFLVKNQ